LLEEVIITKFLDLFGGAYLPEKSLILLKNKKGGKYK